MSLVFSGDYPIAEHHSVIDNIKLIIAEFRILYICEYTNIFIEQPIITNICFDNIGGNWYIYHYKNRHKIYVGNSLMLGIALNYVEPSFDLSNKPLIAIFATNITCDSISHKSDQSQHINANVILYCQRITSLSANKKVLIEHQQQIEHILCKHVYLWINL